MPIAAARSFERSASWIVNKDTDWQRAAI